jgi:hypothetical protein
MKWIKLSAIILLSIAVSACVVAPVQPVGYRMTGAAMPTYVNGQYVGVQGGDVVVQEQVTTTYVPPPIYTYNTYTPYYAPTYINPWYGLGTGLSIGIGINSARGCCWGGHRGWHGVHARGGHRGWHGGHWRGGHRGWRR